jgi:AcrR family transcriptional regulator
MNDESGTGLPASFEMAWGIRDRPTKGPKRGLSLEQVVEAGVTVANAEGLAALSMARIAKELGTSAMSLYRYVASKDELLVLMIDAAFGGLEWNTVVDGDWRERLNHWAKVELMAYRACPWVLHIPVSGAPIMPNQLRFMEWGLRSLGETKLREDEKLSVILLVTSFTRSFAQLASDIASAFAAGDDTVANVMANYGRLIKTLTSAEEFPALHAVVDAGTFDDEDDEFDGLDYDFHFGLARVLDGIEALVRRREET